MDPLVHLDLLVERGTDPIAGWLELGHGRRLSFTGYLEFMALLERVVAGEPIEAEPAS